MVVKSVGNARARVLWLDALINLVLGAALLFFRTTAPILGIPPASQAFYPTILGAVLFGVGLALLWEIYRGENHPVGLGLGGAVVINLSGGAALMAWLLFGDLDVSMRGQIILWALAVVLVFISLAELIIRQRGPSHAR